MTVWHIETDYFAILLLIVMYIKSKFLKGHRTFQDKVFSIVVLVSILSTSVDIFASTVMNDLTGWWIYEISMILYGISVPLLAVLWVCYTIVILIPNDTAKAKRMIFLSLIPFICYTIMALTNPVTELMFSLSSDMVYKRGPLFYTCGIGTDMLYSLLGVALLLAFHKRIKPKSNIILLSTFYILTAASLWIQIANPGWLIISATYAVVFTLCDATIEEQRRQILYSTIQTQNKALQETVTKVEIASNSKSRFLSRMSHEIRTPINAIMGMAELSRNEMDKETPDTELLLNYSNETTAASEYLLSLVNDILDTSRIENNKIELQYNTINAESYLQSIQFIVKPLADNKKVNLKFIRKTFANESYIGDGVRVQQIIVNLISNAIKFTPEGGTVWFEAESLHSSGSETTLQFTVRDNGIGMSKEFQESLFQPFTQENDSNTSPFTGTGLGLSISRELARLMGGDITVSSKKNEGSTFVATMVVKNANTDLLEHDLPEAIAQMGGAKEADDTFADWDFTGVRVLLCEDHPLNQKITVSLLERYNCIVDLACDGVEGLARFQASVPNYYSMILMDIRMPNLDGLQTTAEIRNLKRPDALKIPIIAMSANAFAEDIDKSFAVGMNAHLSKPVDTKKLYNTVAQFTKGSTPTDQDAILIVDDIEVNAVVVGQALKRDYRVLIATDGEEALRLLDKNPDIIGVVTDIQMPGMDGPTLIKSIRTNYKYDHVAILASTQYGGVKQADELLKLGADDFVYKPASPTVLCTRLENILAKYREVIL